MKVSYVVVQSIMNTVNVPEMGPEAVLASLLERIAEEELLLSLVSGVGAGAAN